MQFPFRFKAAVLEENNEPLKIQEVEFKGPLLAGQVLVRVHYSGICGKQIEEIRGTAGLDRFLPHMLGHEGSGVVVDVAPGVKKTKPGDKVVLHWMKGSGLDADTPLYFQGQRRINAGWITTFNEYAVVAENRVTPIAQDADLSLACLLGCAVTTGLGVVLNEAQVPAGSSVAVFGCGGVGLNVIQGAVLAQANPIMAIDMQDHKLELAKRLGATHLINSQKEDVSSKIRTLTQGQGAAFVMIATASLEAASLAVDCCAAPGSVYFIAVPPAGGRIGIDALSIHRRRKLTGSFGGGIWPDRDIPLYWDFYKKGKIDLRALAGSVFPFSKINEAVSQVVSGCPGRGIIKFLEAV